MSDQLTVIVPIKAAQPKFSSRVTVRSDVVFQRDEDRTVRCWGEPHSWEVESDDVAWERVQLVGQEWVELELGWVKEPSLLILRNPEVRFQRNPTKEERVEADARIVEVGFGNENADLLIRPGRDAHFEPGTSMVVRCRSGQVKLSIVAVPR